MYSKFFAVFAALCAVLLATASCEEEVNQPGEIYVLNPGSAFPVIVTDPNSPLLSAENRQIRVCVASRCHSFCRSRGFRIGRCNIQAICVCSR